LKVPRALPSNISNNSREKASDLMPILVCSQESFEFSVVSDMVGRKSIRLLDLISSEPETILSVDPFMLADC
jgi:hypothetical protein